MAHSIVIHVDHADHIDHHHEHGVKALSKAFVEHLKHHGHDVEEAHVHGHDRAHHDLLTGESRHIG